MGHCLKPFVRKQLDDFLRFVDELGLETVEVSDGSMVIDEDDKCEMIHRLAKRYRVLSEVGSRSRHPHQPQQVDDNDAKELWQLEKCCEAKRVAT